MIAAPRQARSVIFDLWKIEKKKLLRKANISTDPRIITSISCDARGRLIVTGFHDGTVSVWDSRTLQCKKTLNCGVSCRGMRITGVKGLDTTQREILLKSGAIVDEEEELDNMFRRLE